MKKYLICTLLVLFSFSMNVDAQNTGKKSRHKIGVQTTFLGGNDVFSFDELDGSASIDGKGFYTIGASYTFILSKKVELQSGLEFSRYKIRIDPPYMGEEFDVSPWNEKVKLLTIPLTANINFGKYFFINGGLLLDFEVSKNNSFNKQSGIGTVLGIGAKYDLDSGISVFINPYYKIHALIPLPLASHHQLMLDYGVGIGAKYHF